MSEGQSSSAVALPATQPAARLAAGLAEGAGRLPHLALVSAQSLLGLLLPLFLLLLWTAASHFGWLPEQILPAPEIVWQTLSDYAADGSLGQDSFISLQRVLRGFALGAGVGL